MMNDVKQLGPVSENMNIINGKPVKAFLDRKTMKAHIASSYGILQKIH